MRQRTIHHPYGVLRMRFGRVCASLWVIHNPHPLYYTRFFRGSPPLKIAKNLSFNLLQDLHL